LRLLNFIASRIFNSLGFESLWILFQDLIDRVLTLLLTVIIVAAVKTLTLIATYFAQLEALAIKLQTFSFFTNASLILKFSNLFTYGLGGNKESRSGFIGI
jgi:hypothetical protein